MKVNFFILLLLSLYVANIFSQLQNYNMNLIANKNDYNSNLYSAIWGYKSPNGREYAILGCYDGTAFYDITDSNNVYQCGFIPGLSSFWREMKTYSHYAYIVSEATGSGLQIVDLQYLPDSVRLVNTVSFNGYSRTHTISQNGPYLYLNGGDFNGGGIFIYDLSSNPVNPVKRGHWFEHYIHDSRIQNDTIWAAAIFDGYIYVIDAVNKDSLRTITRWLNLPQPGPHNTALTNDRKFLYVTDEIGGFPRLLKVWNVENVFNPTLEASWQPTSIDSSIVHNVEIIGNYAVVAHYTAGVRLLNISNPANPIEVAWYDTYPQNNGLSYNGCWGVYLFPESGKIIASDRQTGLYVLKSSAYFIGISNINSNIPKSFKLYQNYPNPFNPVTKIKFELTKSEFAKITVYDINGREVLVIMNSFLKAGQYEFEFNASNFASGIYFYKLSVNNFSDVKKMILIK
jgi:choice-of-anchor B domain-containing protein